MNAGTLSKELKGCARESLNKNYLIPIVAYIFMSAISSVLLSPFEALLQRKTSLSSFLIYAVAMLIISLLTTLMQVGIMKILMDISRKKNPEFQILFYAFKNHPDKFILVTLYIIMLSILAMLPFLLCCIGIAVFHASLQIPVMVFLAVTTYIISMIFMIHITLNYQLAIYLLLDYPDLSVRHALNESKRLMEGYCGKLFYIMCSFAGMILLAFLTCGIASLWIIPYILMTYIYFYRYRIHDLPEEKEAFVTIE